MSREKEEHRDEVDGPYWKKFNFWIVLETEEQNGDVNVHLLNAYDLMRSIDGPGDYGWVAAAPDTNATYCGEFIAHFENCFQTANDAIDAYLMRCQRQREEIERKEKIARNFRKVEEQR